MTVGSPGHICAFAGVNNKGRPSQPSPPSHRARACDGCDDGDGHRLLLWPAHAYMPQAKGVLPGEGAIRGAQAQHCATVWPGNKVCRVCGSHLAVWASGPKAQSLRAYAGWRQRRRCEPWCVPGLQVCTRPHENGQGRKLNAGAGLQPIRWLDCRNRPTSLCAPSGCMCDVEQHPSVD